MPGFANDSANNSIMWSDNVDFSGNIIPSRAITADGQLLIGSAIAPNIRPGIPTSSDNSIIITTGSGSLDFKSNPLVVPDLHTAKWIVNDVPNSGGNQTTIAAAITAASSGETIVVMPGSTGVYTENITLKAGVNLVGYNGDSSTPTVTINGTVTANTAGRFSLSNLRLQTNGASALVVSGTAALTLNANQCWFNVTDATGITFSNSNGSSFVFLNYCMGNCTTNSVKFFDQSGPGLLSFDYCSLFNFGSSAVACTISNGTFASNYSQVPYGIQTTSAGSSQSFYSSFGGSGVGVIAFDHQGTTGQPCVLSHCDFQATGAAAINVGAGATITLWDTSSINCTLPTPITGTGTLKYNILTFGTAGNSAIAAGITQTRLEIGTLYTPYGITFDNTNILQNYDTLPWTPTLTGATTAGTTTYTS